MSDNKTWYLDALLWLRNCIITGLFCLLTACSGLTAAGGRPVAWVDGTPITEGDLKEALKITHRTEAVRPSEGLDLANYVNKLIDDRLVVQEAYRMRLDKDPWLRNMVEEYRLRESVVRLYKEEIADAVNLGDEEIRQFYNQQMESVHIRQITVQTEEEARDIWDQIEAGCDMATLAREHSTDRFKDKAGDRGFLRRDQLPDSVKEVVFSLQQGQITAVIKTPAGYQIIKAEERMAAPEKDLEEIKRIVAKALRKEKEAERSCEVLQRYRNQADLVADEDLLSELPLSPEAVKDKKWAEDDRYMVKIGEEVLTVRDFYQELRNIPESKLVTDNPSALKRRFVDSWIDGKLVDMNALNRHYERDINFGRMLKYYEEYLLKKLFAQKVIYPQIKVSDEVLKNYYGQHRDKYLKPVQYKIRQITVNDEPRAREILEQLQKGADFSWFAKSASQDRFAQKGGDRGWVSADELSPAFSKTVFPLKVGEVSDVLVEEGQYFVLKLEAKSDLGYEDFDHIKDTVRKDYFKENYELLLADYIKQLRHEAEININQPFIQELTESFLPKAKSGNLDRP